MKRKIITTTLTLAAMTGSGFAAIQIWTGVDTTGGWDTTTAEWENDGAPGVPVTWVNGNDATIGGAGGLSSINEAVVVNNLTYTGTGTTMNFNGSALTVNGTMNGVSQGWRFGNDIDGTYTLTGNRSTHTGGTLSASVTVSSGAQLMMTVGSTLTGNVDLDGGTLMTRWGAGATQSMGVLSGAGVIANNAGSGHTAFDTTWTIGQLSLGTDGTIGLMSSNDSGADDVYIMKLGVGSHQFDLNNAGGTLTNDFFDMATSKNRVDVDGSTIALSATGDALQLGDSFTLVSGNGITGTALFDFSAASLDSGLEWDTSTFNTDGAVSVIAAVPEPSSAALLGLGGLALILRRRK